MKKNTLFALWGVMFVICAGLGFISEPEGALRVLLVILAVVFFVPPMMLIHQAKQRNDRNTLALIRNLAALSLGLTAVFLIVNFLSFAASELVGNILYYILIIVTSPMICGQYWVLSMFLWAYLMIACAGALKKK